MTKKYRISNFVLFLSIALVLLFVFLTINTFALFSKLDRQMNVVDTTLVDLQGFNYRNAYVADNGAAAEADAAIEKFRADHNSDFQKTMWFSKFAFILFLTYVLAALANLLTRVNIQFAGDKIIVNGVRNHLIPFLNKQMVIPVSEIRSIRIVRTTPLGPELKDFSKLSWRDNLIIDGAVIPGYFYQNLGNLYQEIVTLRPDLKTEYRKTTVMENLENSY